MVDSKEIFDLKNPSNYKKKKRIKEKYENLSLKVISNYFLK
jgi:hypothetical protein